MKAFVDLNLNEKKHTKADPKAYVLRFTLNGNSETVFKYESFDASECTFSDEMGWSFVFCFA